MNIPKEFPRWEPPKSTDWKKKPFIKWNGPHIPVAQGEK